MSNLMTGRLAPTLAAALAVLLAFVGVAAAKVSAGVRLDPTYGKWGRVALPSARLGYPTRPSLAVLMQDGGLLVPTSRSVLRIGLDGTLDESFGVGGTLTPPPAPGAGFEISGLAVDSQNRIVVAGSSILPVQEQPLGGTVGTIPESARAARVMRFMPNGALDPSFADRGVLETTFGLPVPLDSSGRPILTRPWAEATGVAVDAQDRVILTGGASAGVEFGCAHDWFWNTVTFAALIARLTPAGALDASFGGGDGFFGGSSAAENPLHAELSADPLAGTGGEVTYGPGSAPCPRAEGELGLARLTADGEPQPAFGPRGWLPGWITSAVPGSDGSIVALESLASKSDDPRRVRVFALNPDGTPAAVLRRRGSVVVRPPGPPGSELVSVAVGAEGRVLLGGTLRRADAPNGKDRGRFLITRLEANGKIDMRFGRDGRVATAFKGRTVRGKRLLLDGQGHALLVGAFRRGTRRGPGLAVARYALGD